MLKGRFLPDHPDDLQVIVHDGGPQISPNEPEIVWVTVTWIDGDLFGGRVRSQPHNLRTIHRGGEIKFVMPEGNAPAALLELAARRLGLQQPPRTGWLAPILVTDKYLREREAWIIHPCRRCGLSELFDAPSDLIPVLFSQHPPAAELSRFIAPCPQCAEAMCVESRKSLAPGGAEPVSAAGGLGDSFLETGKLCVENMRAIGRLLGAIRDDATADLILRRLEQAIARHKDLSEKLDSYEMSMEDHRNLAQEHYQEYLATTSDISVSSAAAQWNAASAQSRVPGKAKEIEAAMKKLGLN
jgi:hypothetical protein